MGKKITRRIVLGTTVAALAVGPFVIRHFRRGRTLDLPERKSAFRGSVKKRPVNVVRERFFSEWQSQCREFVFQSKKIEGVDSVKVVQDLSKTRKFSFKLLTSYTLCIPRPVDEYTMRDLAYYEVMSGSLLISGGSRPVLTVNVEENEKRTYRIQRSIGGVNIPPLKDSGGYKFASSNDDVSQVEPANPVRKIAVTPLAIGSFSFAKTDNFFSPSYSNGNVLDIREASSTNTVFRYANKVMSRLFYPYPKETLILGTSFALPPSQWFVENTIQQSRVESLELSGHSKAVKFYGERKIDTQENVEIAKSVLLSLENQLWKSSEEKSQATKKAMQRVKFIGDHKASEKWEHTCYTDVQSGLTLYRVESVSDMCLMPTRPPSESSLHVETTSTLFKCTDTV